MTDDTSKSLDLLGVKPIASAVEHASKATIEGASNFLSSICMPVAEEVGLLLRDRVRAYRAQNTAAILLEAETKLEKHQPGAEVAAHPRLVAATLDSGGWSDDDSMQKMWAGLLASACTPDGHDDSNLIFTDLLSRLTASQARIVNFACEMTPKTIGGHGLIVPRKQHMVATQELLEISGLSDIHRLDMELDHLRGNGLIEVGFDGTLPTAGTVDATATGLALNFYVRCQGYIGSAPDYFGLTPTPEKAPTE
jgi:hypothetical protein